MPDRLRVKLEQTVLERYRKGQMTLRQGAELLGISYMEMDELLREHGVALASDVRVARRRGRAKGRP